MLQLVELWLFFMNSLTVSFVGYLRCSGEGGCGLGDVLILRLVLIFGVRLRKQRQLTLPTLPNDFGF